MVGGWVRRVVWMVVSMSVCADGDEYQFDHEWETVLKLVESKLDMVWNAHLSIGAAASMGMAFNMHGQCSTEQTRAALWDLTSCDDDAADASKADAVNGFVVSFCTEQSRQYLFTQFEAYEVDYFYVCLRSGEFWERVPPAPRDGLRHVCDGRSP